MYIMCYIVYFNLIVDNFTSYYLIWASLIGNKFRLKHSFNFLFNFRPFYFVTDALHIAHSHSRQLIFCGQIYSCRISCVFPFHVLRKSIMCMSMSKMCRWCAENQSTTPYWSSSRRFSKVIKIYVALFLGEYFRMYTPQAGEWRPVWNGNFLTINIQFFTLNSLCTYLYA